MDLGLSLVILLLHQHDARGVQLETLTALPTLVGEKIKEGAINTILEGAILAQKPDAALKYAVDTIVTLTLLGCLRLIPNTADIPPLDLNLDLGGKVHLTADNGKLRGLSSVKVRPIIYDFDDYGNILITFPITFTDLHVVYERFQLDCWPIIITGKADLKFTDSEVNLNIKLAKPFDFLAKLAIIDCVFHVRSVQFTGFHEMEPNIILDGDNDHKFLSDHVFPVVATEIKKVLLHLVDVRVTNSLYDSLPVSGSWLCRDPNLNRLTLQTTGPVTFTPAGIANWLPASTRTDADTPVTDVDQYDDVL